MNLLEEKKQLRARLKQLRADISAESRRKKSEEIHEKLAQLALFDDAKTVFCFISYLNEIDTHPLISQLMEQKRCVCVPKIIDKTTMIAVNVTDWEELAQDSYGILTPISSEAADVEFDIALTPGLGFTRAGGRIGYGRGYYDRWFSKNRVKTKIGLAFNEQIIPELPIEENDVLLDMLITDQQTIII